MRLLGRGCGLADGDAGRGLHRVEPAKEQGRHDAAHLRVREGATGSEPGEHPIDHPKQQHRHRLVQASLDQSGADFLHHIGKGLHHTPLGRHDLLLLLRAQELDVFGEHPVLVAGSSVLIDEAQDQALQPADPAGVIIDAQIIGDERERRDRQQIQPWQSQSVSKFRQELQLVMRNVHQITNLVQLN